MSVSLRKAINAKCRDCIYDPKSGLGAWRQQTDGCTSTQCPLWPVRPRSEAKKAPNGGNYERPTPATHA